MNVVVGGGWSGLAAAVELAHRGLPVTLIEAADRLGGRARSVDYRGRVLDNGQHLLIGAYGSIAYLHRLLGLAESDLFERRPLELRMYSRAHPAVRVRLPALPAPLHLFAGLLGASGLGLSDRMLALRFCAVLRAPRAAPDCSVAELLGRCRQTPRLVDCLWRPLCLAALNTPIETASAAIFGRVLRDAFGRRRGDSDLLFPRRPLGELLPEPARRFIEARGGRVLLRQRATGIESGRESGREAVTAVALADGARVPAGQLIIALPPEAAARLLARHPVTAVLAADLERLESAPICTVYLEYPDAVSLPFPMTGFAGTTAQWAFDLATRGHPGLIAVVVSGPGRHTEDDGSTLIDRVARELAGFFPDWPAPAGGHVLREKRATLVSRVGIDALRPGQETPFANCWLAGDATAAGYPATLEGAVRSGIACARAILSDQDIIK